MKTLAFLLICGWFGITLDAKADATTEMKKRAEAEGVVLLELAKDHKKAEIFVLDIPASEINEIKKVTPSLHQKIMTEDEFDSAYGKNPNAASRAQNLSLQVVEIQENTATILGGTPLKGISGSRDRFSLKQVSGKWVLVKREPYEIS